MGDTFDREDDIGALAAQYAMAGRLRGIYYLELMARLYADVGRGEGSREQPWVTIIPHDNWAVQELDYRIVAQLCHYLGCTRADLGLVPRSARHVSSADWHPARISAP